MIEKFDASEAEKAPIEAIKRSEKTVGGLTDQAIELGMAKKTVEAIAFLMEKVRLRQARWSFSSSQRIKKCGNCLAVMLAPPVALQRRGHKAGKHGLGKIVSGIGRLDGSQMRPGSCIRIHSLRAAP